MVKLNKIIMTLFIMLFLISASYSVTYNVQEGNYTDFQNVLSNANNGDVLRISGEYYFTDNMEIESNIEIIGEGTSTKLYPSGSACSDTFIRENSGVTKVILRDFYIDATSCDTTIIELRDDANEYIEIQDLYIVNATGTAISLSGKFVRANHNTILGAFNGIKINDDEIVNPYSEVKYNYITTDLNPSSTEEYGEGIEVNIHDYSEAQIVGNVIKGFREEGIDCNTETATITGNTIEMVSTETRKTIGINYNSEVIGFATISGNIISGVPDEEGRGISVSRSIGGAIMGNTIRGISDDDDSRGIDIGSAGLGLTIMGNNFENLKYGMKINNYVTFPVGNSCTDTCDYCVKQPSDGYNFIDHSTFWVSTADAAFMTNLIVGGDDSSSAILTVNDGDIRISENDGNTRSLFIENEHSDVTKLSSIGVNSELKALKGDLTLSALGDVKLVNNLYSSKKAFFYNSDQVSAGLYTGRNSNEDFEITVNDNEGQILLDQDSDSSSEHRFIFDMSVETGSPYKYLWQYNNVNVMELDDGVLQINILEGTGNAFACINSEGSIYRSNVSCN